jgi:hypothetical protein
MGGAVRFVPLYREVTLTEVSTAAPKGCSSYSRDNRCRLPDCAPVIFYTPRPIPFAHEGMIACILADQDSDCSQFVQDCETSTDVLPPLYLLGLLTNYNKFEFQNPYRLRLDDFVNDAIIQDMVTCFGNTCTKLRDAYVAVQDDMPEGWTLGSTLSYIGLGALAPNSRPSTPVPAPDEAKSLFVAL